MELTGSQADSWQTNDHTVNVYLLIQTGKGLWRQSATDKGRKSTQFRPSSERAPGSQQMPFELLTLMCRLRGEIGVEGRIFQKEERACTVEEHVERLCVNRSRCPHRQLQSVPCPRTWEHSRTRWSWAKTSWSRKALAVLRNWKWCVSKRQSGPKWGWRGSWAKLWGPLWSC